MEDFIILNSGYQSAINDTLKILQDLNEFDVINDRLLRIAEKHRLINSDSGYEGNINKYYDKENDLGYIVYDDIFELKGVMIFVSQKQYKPIEEKDLIFIKNTMQSFSTKNFKIQKLMQLEYEEMLEKFKKI